MRIAQLPTMYSPWYLLHAAAANPFLRAVHRMYPPLSSSYTTPPQSIFPLPLRPSLTHPIPNSPHSSIHPLPIHPQPFNASPTSHQPKQKPEKKSMRTRKKRTYLAVNSSKLSSWWGSCGSPAGILSPPTRVEKHAAALLCTRGVAAKREEGVAATKRDDARVRRAATAKDILWERSGDDDDGGGGRRSRRVVVVRGI